MSSFRTQSIFVEQYNLSVIDSANILTRPVGKLRSIVNLEEIHPTTIAEKVLSISSYNIVANHNLPARFVEKCIDFVATRFQKCLNINANHLTFAVSRQVEPEIVLALLPVDQLTYSTGKNSTMFSSIICAIGKI